MHRCHTVVCAFGALLLMLFIANGCGSGAGLGSSPGVPGSDLHAGGASLHQLLGELDALPTPKGVSAAEFASLKGALRDALVNSGVTRFAAEAPTGAANAVDDLMLDFIDDGAGNVQDAISWTYRSQGDYDQNGEVNVADLTELGKNLKKTVASPDWLTKGQFADGDHNGEVNSADITPLGQNLLNQVQGYIIEGAADPAGPWTNLATADFASSAFVDGARHFAASTAAIPSTYYRVTPQDATQNLGEPSAPSVSFILQDNAELTGQAGGPQTVSCDGTTGVIQLPDSNPTTIVVGDVVLLNDPTLGGFLLTVDTINQAGDQVTITGTNAPLNAFIKKGQISAGGDQTAGSLRADWQPDAKATSALNFSFNLPNQVLHTGNGIEIRLFKCELSYDMLVDTSGSLAADGSVSRFFARTDLSNFDMNFDCVVDSIDTTASFNASPFLGTPDPNYEVLIDSQVVKAKVPLYLPGGPILVDSPVTSKVYLGVSGFGAMNGYHRFDERIQYTSLSNYAGWTGGAAASWNGFGDALGIAQTSARPPAGRGTSGSYFFYARIETAGLLMNNPAQKSSLVTMHALGLVLNKTTTPTSGYDFGVGAVTAFKRDIDFTALGDPRLALNELDPEAYTIDTTGFVAEQGQFNNVSGQITEDTDGDLLGDVPLEGVTVNLYNNDNPTNPVLLDTQVTGIDGILQFLNVPKAHNLKVTAEKTNFSFDPVMRLIEPYNGGINPGNDFFATSTGGGTDTISGNVLEDTNGDGTGDIPMANCLVFLYDNTDAGNPVTLDAITVDAAGDYSFANVTFRGPVKILPTLFNYAFAPAETAFTYSGGLSTGNDFVGVFAPDVGIFGNITNGLGLAVPGVNVEFRRMPEDSVVWTDMTDLNGQYNTGPRFTPGITIRVIPSLAGSSFSPPFADLVMDSDKVQDFVAFP